MTAKLVLMLNDDVISEHELDKESMSIGRKTLNNIHIDSLAVSGKHAQIITILNDSFLEDLNSTNGTYVNGSLIKKHALKNGDVISVGKHHLRYENANSSEETEGEFEKTMVIRPDAAGMPDSTGSHEVAQSVSKIVKEESKKAVAPADGKVGGLQILSGANAGKELMLTKALSTLGKPGTQVAAITRRPQGYFIIHVEGGSKSQTPIINGAAIGTQATMLNDHDIIEVAGVKMEFFLS